MATLLIAVGGTGQHVALAVARMVFIGALPPVELAVIDSDNAGDLSVALKEFGGTVAVGGYTGHPLGGGEVIYPPFKDVHGNPTFQQLFVSPNPDSVELEVFEVCVDEESAGFEVKKGMFGRPSLGAAIFASNKETQLQDVLRKAKQSDPIFVAGSLVGGTGAGLIHQLIKSLPRDGRQLYGLIFLNWFRIPVADAGVEQTVDDSTQERNMRYGLDYFFRETRDSLKASLLIGQPSAEPAVFAGTGEIKHYFHLVAAHAMLKIPEDTVKHQALGSIYAAAFDPARRETLYEEEWQGGRSLRWYVNRANYVKAVLDYASSKKFQDEVWSVVSPGMLGFRVTRAKPENVGSGLAEALERYPGKERESAVRVMAETWGGLSRQYKYCLDWLDAVAGPLPDEMRDEAFKRVKDNPVQRLGEIQRVWARSLPEWQKGSEPPPQAAAHEFHKLLVQSYE